MCGDKHELTMLAQRYLGNTRFGFLSIKLDVLNGVCVVAFNTRENEKDFTTMWLEFFPYILENLALNFGPWLPT